MSARARLNLDDLTRSKPAAAPAPVRSVKMVRSTMDLPADRHAEFVQWAARAGVEVGRTVRGQHVLRALVARLLTDEDLAAKIVTDLSSQ